MVTEDLVAESPRVTRSNRVFSCYSGAKIVRVPTNFDAGEALQELEACRLERLKQGLGEFDDDEDGITEDDAAKNSPPTNKSDTPIIPAASTSSATSALKRHHSDRDQDQLAAFQLSEHQPKKMRHHKAEKRDQQKQRQHEHRRIKRETERAESGHPFKKVAVKKGAKSAGDNVVPVILNAGQLKIVETGWTGVRRGRKSRKTYSLKEAKDAGLKELEWDGKETCVLATEKDLCIAILGAAQTDDPTFVQHMMEGTNALNAVSREIRFTTKEQNNDRGTSAACAKGVSLGGGQKHPQILSHSARTGKALSGLVELPLFERLSGRANHFLEFYAPRAYCFQKHGLEQLLDHHKELELNFPNTAFAACTWNFGPQFVCYPHLDANNSPFTWCAITAMGDFDPSRGGHLILWDLGLIIRFPPGATILIPSALLVHSNTTVQPGETRHSFVQYTAGGLFCWIDHNFQTVEDWNATATEDMVKQRKAEDMKRVATGLGMFSTTDELRNRYSSTL
ncbi:hypothetical protein VNI00_016217 [Paramarasmius palmivorus]|uniref:Uncharacterized protein n=1 Tax=Paramarasmius palmivorus TaxID=297713 RepID=A0AAW0BEC9_9AGAR